MDAKFRSIGLHRCFISEITVAELKFGAEKSQKIQHNRKVTSTFIEQMNVLPIYSGLDIYAKEKARLQKLGSPVDDFDLLIGSTAISNKLILVTNNTRHFERMKGIDLENWSEKK